MHDFLEKAPFPRRKDDSVGLFHLSGLCLNCFVSPFGAYFWTGAGFLILVGLLLPYTPARLIAALPAAAFGIELCFAVLFRPRCRITRDLPLRVRRNSEFTISYKLANRAWLPAFDVEADPQLDEAGLKFEKRLFFPSLAARAEDSGIAVMRAEKRFQNSGLNRLAKISEADDFRGCREFRATDNPRHIHWPTSARLGKLAVKEFQEEYLTRAALLLDTKLPGRRHAPEALEAALSLAAAAADYLTRDECVVDLFAAGSEVKYLRTGRGISGFETVLDLLAETESSYFFELGKLRKAVLENILGIGSALLILLDADEERRNLVSALRAGGCHVKAVVVAAAPPPDLPKGWLFLNSSDIEAGKADRI